MFRSCFTILMVVDVGYLETTHDFNYWYGLPREYDIETMRWLDNIPWEKWARVFDDKVKGIVI